jgi:hypothetical protein
MTDTTPHRATPEQWTDAGAFASDTRACLLELRARIEALEDSYETMRLAALEWGKDVDKLMRWSDQHLRRIEKLEAGATCPHIVTSDEGTSYCALAEQPARIGQSDVPANTSAPIGSLVERVAIACAKPCNETWDDQARAAIREVAAWMRENECGYNAIRWLEQEAERG